MSQGVEIHAAMIFFRLEIEVYRDERHSTFVQLCSDANFAVRTVEIEAARIPRILLATMAIPVPEPQIKIPLCDFPRATLKATFAAKSG